MKREPTFNCVDCGNEGPQAPRGGYRTRCPACLKEYRLKYCRDYYEGRKAKQEAAA